MEWIAIVYDKPGADRAPVIAQHKAAVPGSIKAAIVTNAGPIFEDEERTKFAGSAFNLIANSKEEVIEFLKNDIFGKSGIWDIDSVVVHPLGVAYRKKQDLQFWEKSIWN